MIFLILAVILGFAAGVLATLLVEWLTLRVILRHILRRTDSANVLFDEWPQETAETAGEVEDV